MKIVHIIYGLYIGGAETMLIDIICEQSKKQSVTIVIVNNILSNILLEQIDNRVNIIHIDRMEKSRNIVPIMKLNWQLLLLNPDVIHCHNDTLIKLILNRKNTVLTVHGLKSPTENFKFYKRIYAVSNAVKKDIEKRSNIKAFKIYNGIKLDSIKIKKNYEFDIFRIVQVGRLDHLIKGQHIILNALNIIVNELKIKNAILDFIGDGTSLNYLLLMVKKFKLEKHVNFLGIKDRKYIYKHLKDYNLLVQPSIYEGFGLSIVEAMAAKLPVLVSNIDGPLEVIKNENYGWIFKSESPRDCANEILKIYNTYDEAPSICNKALTRVKKCFNIIETSESYMNNYKFISNN